MKITLVKITLATSRRVSAPALLLLVPILLVPILALAGCGHKDTIVGKWQGAITQPTGTMNATFEFTPDGKETVTGQMNAGGMTRSITIGGTYTVAGNNLTQNLTTMTMDSRTLSLPAHSSHPQPFTLDGDHLTLSDPGNTRTLTLTRMKQ